MIHIPHREDSIFSLVYLIVFIAPLIFIPIFPEGYETVKYPLFCLLTGVGVLVLSLRKQISFHKPSAWLLAGFVILHALSAAFSLDHVNSIIGLYGRYVGSIFFISSWAMFIVLVWNAIKQDEQRRITIMRLLWFDAFAVAVLGILQYYDLIYYNFTVESARPIIPSFIGNQNFYAMFLIGVLPVGVAIWKSAQNKFTKPYLIVSLLAILFALILSGSRGGVLGLGTALATVLLVTLARKYGRTYLYALGGVAIVVTALYFSFFAGTRSDNTSAGSQNATYTVQSRYSLWNNTFEVIKQNPVLGVGTGTLFIAYSKLDSSVYGGEERFDDAHNIFLNIAATVGLPALIVFLALLIVSVILAWRETEFQKESAIWILAGLFGVLAASQFNPVSVAIWLLLGLILAMASSNATITRDIPKFVKAAGIIIGVVLIVFSIAFIGSETLTVYGKAAYKDHRDATAEKLLKPALTLNPYNYTAEIFLIGAQINLHQDEHQLTEKIDKVIARHELSSGITKTAADLNYRLYLVYKKDEYKQRMNELYTQAIEMEPGLPYLYGSAAYSYYKTGQTDKALQYLEQQQSLSGKEFPYLMLLKAKIYIDMGKKDLALAAVKEAAVGLPDEPLIKFFLEKAQAGADVLTLPFPVSFPDTDI